MEIRPPRQETLDKYGLSMEEWKALWESQGKRCPICGKFPKTGSPCEFNIDHKHFPRFHQMAPELRKKFVRGILCQWCNRSYMAKAMTIAKAHNIITYLQRSNI